MSEQQSISSLRLYPGLGTPSRTYNCRLLSVGIPTIRHIRGSVPKEPIPTESFTAFYGKISSDNKSGLLLKDAKTLDADKLRKALGRLIGRFKAASKRRAEVTPCVFFSKDEKTIIRLRLASGGPIFEPFELGDFR